MQTKASPKNKKAYPPINVVDAISIKKYLLDGPRSAVWFRMPMSAQSPHPPRGSIHVLTAIDGDISAGDECRLVR